MYIQQISTQLHVYIAHVIPASTDAQRYSDLNVVKKIKCEIVGFSTGMPPTTVWQILAQPVSTRIASSHDIIVVPMSL